MALGRPEISLWIRGRKNREEMSFHPHLRQQTLLGEATPTCLIISVFTVLLPRILFPDLSHYFDFLHSPGLLSCGTDFGGLGLA